MNERFGLIDVAGLQVEALRRLRRRAVRRRQPGVRLRRPPLRRTLSDKPSRSADNVPYPYTTGGAISASRAGARGLYERSKVWARKRRRISLMYVGSTLSKAIRMGALASALTAAAVLGTAVGSAGGPYDEWGCPPGRIGDSIYTPAEGGGYASPEETLAALAPFLVADGARAEADYAEALASRTGPDRFEPQTGHLYINDRIEARITLAQLADGTWTVENEMLCHRPVPPETSDAGARGLIGSFDLGALMTA